MNKDTLGDRMKQYEAVSSPLLTRRMPVFIRIDGKAFHTFTRGMEKPYYMPLVAAMVVAARRTAEEMQGFKLAYIQSDEVTFMISDTDTLETQPWFGNELNKLVSITASAFTAHFNCYWHLHIEEDVYPVAMFDARAFNIPIEDAPNNFIWRQRDWERNSIQMLARAHFSHKELNGKKVPEMEQMLRDKGVNPDQRTDQMKYGTFLERDLTITHNREDYETLKARL